MSSARHAAVSALMAYHSGKSSAETALDKQISGQKLDGRDTALATKLTFGVLQNRALLDFYLGQFLSTPVEKLQPRVLDILRVAAYQIVFLDRVPPRAAVDEAVQMTKTSSPKAAGLVNAVLRRLTEAVGATVPGRPPPPEPPSLAIKYSHPEWMVQRFIDLLGEDEAEALLAANNAEVPIYAQINTLKADAIQLDGAEPHPWLPNCLVLQGVGNPAHLQPFQDGLLYIQDPAAKRAILAADPQPGTSVLDACAAPGGKSFAAAIQMGNKGEILASDLQEKKLAKIEEGANRLGIDIIKTRAMDARTIGLADPLVDTVIVDAPCSGLGIIRKKPEIRYKTPEEIARLPEIQLEILTGAARAVAPGGTLLYATCTILPEENSGVVEAFLSETTDFSIEEQRTLYPHTDGTDGFFYCKLRRRK